MFRRFERLEMKQTIKVEESMVHKRYREMTDVLYGGGDTGAYETDALDRSRREETCLYSIHNRPLLIDAYIRVDPWDHRAVRHAMHMAAGKGIAICINLPAAFASIRPPKPWDVPADQPPVGVWAPGSWGGHSMWAFEYDERGIWLEHTWDLPAQLLTWRAAGFYMDEAHIVIDRVNEWRQRKEVRESNFNMDDVVSAVNAVSSQKIKVA